jgi:N-acetylneuraminic acid mutarotase
LIERDGAPGAALGGEFYVIGGRLAFDQATGAISEVERYSPATNSWSQVADMPVATNGFPAVAVRRQVVVFGGEEPSTPDLRRQGENGDTQPGQRQMELAA